MLVSSLGKLFFLRINKMEGVMVGGEEGAEPQPRCNEAARVTSLFYFNFQEILLHLILVDLRWGTFFINGSCFPQSLLDSPIKLVLSKENFLC